MDLAKLKQASEIMTRLVTAHDDLQRAQDSKHAREVRITQEEQLNIFTCRVAVLENELRKTGVVAAVQKPAGLRSIPTEERKNAV